MDPAASRLLVGICSCELHRDRRGMVRATWLGKSCEGIETVFFTGEGAPPGEKDLVTLPVPDTYEALPVKVWRFFQYALREHAFDFLFKCDDDSYVVLDRLRGLIPLNADYVGDETLVHGWGCGGAGYLLSRRAVELVAASPEPGPGPEDVWVAGLLRAAGMRILWSGRLREGCQHHPSPDNDLISAHRCSAETMLEMQAGFQPLAGRCFHATHKAWSGPLTLLEGGLFRGGAAAPHGRWETDKEGAGLLLRWYHWPPDRLAPTEDGYANGQLRLVRKSD